MPFKRYQNMFECGASFLFSLTAANSVSFEGVLLNKNPHQTYRFFVPLVFSILLSLF